MYIRATMALAAILCAAAVTTLAGQQAPVSAGAARTGSALASSPTPWLLGPRLSPQFARFEPNLAEPTSGEARRAFLAAEGGQHTIVISTLAVVLGAIIVVLLIVR